MTHPREILNATPAYIIATLIIAIGCICLALGIGWTLIRALYRTAMPEKADDYPWADYSEEDGPAHQVERGRKVGAL